MGPHRGDSNEYTQQTIISIKKRKSPAIIQNTIISAAMSCFFFKGLKNKFETSHQCSSHWSSTVVQFNVDGIAFELIVSRQTL